MRPRLSPEEWRLVARCVKQVMDECEKQAEACAQQGLDDEVLSYRRQVARLSRLLGTLERVDPPEIPEPVN